MTWMVILSVVVTALGAVTYFCQHGIDLAKARVASDSQLAQTACGPDAMLVLATGSQL